MDYAEVNRDRPALEHIVDERFIATFSNTKCIDRAAYLDWIKQSALKPFTVSH